MKVAEGLVVFEYKSFSLKLSLWASKDYGWLCLPLEKASGGFTAKKAEIEANLLLDVRANESVQEPDLYEEVFE